MSKKLVPLAELVVHKGRPDNDNPFRGSPFNKSYPTTEVCGDERVEALRAFCGTLAGKGIGDYTFWSLVRGDVREITDPYDVDWSDLRTPSGKYVEGTGPRVDAAR